MVKEDTKATVIYCDPVMAMDVLDPLNIKRQVAPAVVLRPALRREGHERAAEAFAA